jgi:2-amino-4-hydroxy-6-hydroxymethyldihydropteridine diphosphokinase
LRQALDAVAGHARVLACSALYSTEPVGYLDQGWFLNGVAKVATRLTPEAMLERLHEIELALGRERRIRNGPRTIDLDILYWGDTVLDEPGLTVPHPRAHERLFVVAPWSDLAPELVLPNAGGRTLGQLRQDLAGSAEVELYSPAPW